jgi:hypothetical protein
MDISQHHPSYDLYYQKWDDMRTMYLGARAIKEKGERYLPPTTGMRLDGMKTKELGKAMYEAYKDRAIFYEFVKEAVETKVGLLHQQSANIQVPPALEAMKERATPEGETMEALLRRINEEQLATGRVGLLLDLKVGEDGVATPYIALYTAESIINWDANLFEHETAALNLVVLNETGYIRQGFDWKTVTSFRVLQLGLLNVNEQEGEATYKQGVFSAEGSDKKVEYNEGEMLEPVYMGATLKEIPFVIINSKDITSEPDNPPLLPLGDLSVSIYRSEADYRQNLHMQGQDTFVTIGDMENQSLYDQAGKDAPIRVGAGAHVAMSAGGDAKYVGLSSQGLAEQRQAIDADKLKANDLAGRLVSPSGTNQESGAALTTRLTAATATLNQVALTGAAGLEKLLKIAAVWVGADPDEVEVTPNIEFANFELKAQEFNFLITAKEMGLPLSELSLHALLVERGYSTMTYEDELEQIAEEKARKEEESAVSGPGADVPPPGFVPPNEEQDGQVPTE